MKIMIKYLLTNTNILNMLATMAGQSIHIHKIKPLFSQ
jgi:hypothetical protein